MLSQSFTAYLFTRLFAWLENAFNGSFIARALRRIAKITDNHIETSRTCEWIRKDVFTQGYYDSSLFYKLLGSIVRFVLGLARSVQARVKKIFEGSLTGYLFDKVISCQYMSVDVVLALFIALMFITPHELWNNLYAFLGAAFFAFWIFMSIASGKIKGKSVRMFNVTIIGFVTAIIVSTVTAVKFSDAIRICLFMLASVMLTYSVYISLDTKEKLMRFLKIVLFAVSVTAILGIVQRLMGIEVDPEYVDINANKGMPGRVFSTFANPNNFAELLLLFIPFFVPLFLFVKKKTEKTVIAMGFVLTLVALVMTYSRSCWVGFALATVLFVLLYDKRFILPLIAVALLAIPLLPQTVMNRIFTIGSMKDSSNSYRLYIWESCLMMIRDFGNVGLGLGPASFKAVYANYADQVALTAPHSHMLYMEIIIEMGLLGFLSFMGYMYAVVKKATSRLRLMDNTLKGVAVASMSSLLGIAFVCCAEYVWFYPRVMFAFWIIPGILLSAAHIAKKQ